MAKLSFVIQIFNYTREQGSFSQKNLSKFIRFFICFCLRSSMRSMMSLHMASSKYMNTAVQAAASLMLTAKLSWHRHFFSMMTGAIVIVIWKKNVEGSSSSLISYKLAFLSKLSWMPTFVAVYCFYRTSNYTLCFNYLLTS